ncbi:hypothetical protein HanRHA438_Chr10g0460721 [Helianthus annuus]|nr:hypothetical protein HanRHA438_Chr10g0460721 [Helianthus annuus]
MKLDLRPVISDVEFSKESLETTRHVSVIIVTLSKKELDSSSVGALEFSCNNRRIQILRYTQAPPSARPLAGLLKLLLKARYLLEFIEQGIMLVLSLFRFLRANISIQSC